MTTIAVKDGVIAADSLVSAGGVKLGERSKIIKHNATILATAGEMQYAEVVSDWVRGGMKERRPHVGETFVAILIKQGRVFFMDTNLCPYEIEAPFHAIGSGREFALGAMAAGASAEQAVAIAAQLDTNTGGDITVVNTEDTQ